jgi:tyrosyl-tRNA synthetase
MTGKAECVDDGDGIDVAALIVGLELASSKTAARRLIKHGSVMIGTIRIIDPFAKMFLDPARSRRFWIGQRSS